MSTRAMNFVAVTCAIFASLLGLAVRTEAADEEKPQPIELPGIHNAFRVTERILAGSQPEGDAAFAALAKAAAPDAGKLFIHCHHGKHRGPAAVGVLCEAVAGWSPAQADAWLKQAGTATDYPGLYRAVREFRAPTPEDIARIGALPETAKTPALVDAMVAIDERFDALKSAQTAGWKTPPEKTEAASAHHATLLWEQLRELARTDDTAKRPDDFRKLLADSEHAAAALRDTLRTSPATAVKLDAALKQTTQSCAACHKVYRNEKK